MAFGPIIIRGTKVDEFPGVAPATQGARITIPASEVGISTSRVITVSSSVDYSGVGDTAVPPEFSAEPGLQYSVWINEAGLNFQLHATNSGSIINKPFVIIVVHS